MRLTTERRIFDGLITGIFLILVATPWHLWFQDTVSLTARLELPSAAHFLGTDNLGRDLLLRFAAAARGAVLPLWLCVCVGFACGIGVGLLHILATAKTTKRLVMRLVHTVAIILAGIPVGVMAFGLSAAYQQNGLLPVMLSLGIIFAVRSYHGVLELFYHDAQLGYWEANECLGGGSLYRAWRYGIMTNWRPMLLDQLAFQLKVAVTIEAALSYLGFGVQEPNASFGNILASHMDTYLKGDAYILVMTILCLALTAAFPTSCATLVRGVVTRRTENKGTNRARRAPDPETFSLYKSAP